MQPDDSRDLQGAATLDERPAATKYTFCSGESCWLPIWMESASNKQSNAWVVKARCRLMLVHKVG